MDESVTQQPSTALIEAANRAEATALLIRCGYHVYRPEADVNGEDLVVKLPDGQLVAVQLKGRATVNHAKYSDKNIWMLFPSAPYSPSEERNWFFIPHDDLFQWVSGKHSKAPKWDGHWHYPKLPKDLLEFLESRHKIQPPKDRFTWYGGDLEVLQADGSPVSDEKI